MEKQFFWLETATLGLAMVLSACAVGPPVEVVATPQITATLTPTTTATLRPQTTRKAPTASPEVFGQQITPTQQPAPNKTPTLACPDVDKVYQLDYVHEVVQDMPNARFEHQAESGAAFFLTIHDDGSVDSNDFDNSVEVSISGTFADCVLEGVATLRAEIQGVCSNGIAALHIIENWEDVSTTTTCPSGTQSVGMEGLTSAPEDRFEFELKEEGDTRILDASIGILSTYYSWTLRESGLENAPTPEN